MTDAESRVETTGRAGTWFGPDLVDAFQRVAERDDLWHGLAAPDLDQRICALDPALSAIVVDGDYLDDIAEGFAKVVDSKSPYTAGHSERVTLFTDMVAEELGLSMTRRRWPKRAAMPISKALAIMHDDMGTAIDDDCFGALVRAMKRLDASEAA